MTIIRSAAHHYVRKRVQRLDSGRGHHMSPGYGYMYDTTPLMEARGAWMTLVSIADSVTSCIAACIITGTRRVHEAIIF